MERSLSAQGVGLSAQQNRGNDRAVALWLLVCCAMIFAMAVIGAITRLTESGLSIMEWAPFTGALPPLSQAEWQRVFALYQQIPEYTQTNAGMSLDEFKTIFWWEYIHRLWGRLIGVVFALPFLWFWLRGKLRPGLAPHLLLLFVLGGLQGALGWFMVASGFGDRVDVSQYRLTAHLLLALALYAYSFWLAAGLFMGRNPAAQEDRSLGRALMALLALLTVTLASGGFVAGLNAGLIYNTFPLMDGDVVPASYWQLTPPWLNFFENIAAVQFNHRLLAVTTLAAALGLWLWSLSRPLTSQQKSALALVLMAALGQLALGIATLLLVVPIWLGALHQAGAIITLTAVIWALRVAYPPVGTVEKSRA